MSDGTLLDCLYPLTEKVRCPQCRTVQTLEETDSLGSRDGCVFCKWCHRQFEPIVLTIQGTLFDENAA